MWGLFLYGAYKCNVVVVIKVGAYIHVVLILYGCLLSHFMVVCSSQHNFTATWKSKTLRENGVAEKILMKSLVFGWGLRQDIS